MKKYCLWLAVLIMSWSIMFAEIKNGYGPEIEGIRESLKSLNILLTEDNTLSLFQKLQIKNKIYKLRDYITYYELTEELLTQFKTIAPDLFNEIDSLKDNNGQIVKVFVRFVPENEMRFRASGTTNLAHFENDRNTYYSEYGPATVSVKIASVNKSLSLLAHEFGHVKYQVPNLASYIEYYSTWYQNETFNSNYIGHNDHDPSGMKALEYENTFRDYYLSFLKTAPAKWKNAQALLEKIRRAALKNVF
ncbi:MAG TPA: hypothetical protein VK666_19860 [Chryseolinea sp.]|nr:hypothetical protein [Chryseolinea sp.]